ncbi:MAG: YdeI/OmpD-associated family protein [Planctomycetes bacterium]|nr:YdeI/OmpD-associated family protein [Planctomycetota bacterium]MBI3862738.1 YdeI/OmpD-associated family protein [Planctomycetia bacterium]
MKNRSPEFDAYIEKSAKFARPILKKIRALYHKACPQIEEKMKWGFPHFEYQGIVGSMAAFKNHAAYGFWKARLLKDPQNLLAMMAKASMGHAKITSIDELPPDRILVAYICEAVALNQQGIKLPARKKTKRPKEVIVPADLAAALKQNRKALATFEAFSPSHKREYVNWITAAKKAETRERRLATAIEWMAEGKSHNWRYQSKQKSDFGFDLGERRT